LIIVWQDLSEEALTGVIEDFVTREGTEYGQHETSLSTKVAAVKNQLERGLAIIVFDPESETCSVQTADARQ
jgi:uncharacterized protein YheU (UPF0270 family)